FGGASNYGASGTHLTRFTGTTAQTIFFQTPQTHSASSHFQDVEFANSAGATFTTNAFINAEPTLSAASGNVTTSGGFTITVADDIIDAVGGRWQVTNTTCTGTNVRLPATLVTNLTFAGGAVLSNGFAVTGNVTVTGGLNLNGSTVSVSGTFTTSTSGTLTMQNPADALLVVGGANFAANGNTNGLLTAGILELRGNFIQNGSFGFGSASNYAPSGTHLTRFTGSTAQSIFFQT